MPMLCIPIYTIHSNPLTVCSPVTSKRRRWDALNIHHTNCATSVSKHCLSPLIPSLGRLFTLSCLWRHQHNISWQPKHLGIIHDWTARWHWPSSSSAVPSQPPPGQWGGLSLHQKSQQNNLGAEHAHSVLLTQERCDSFLQVHCCPWKSWPASKPPAAGKATTWWHY